MDQQPSAGATADDRRNALRKRVAAMYEKYAPEKLANLDSIVDRNVDRPRELMEALIQKYGPEPSTSAESPKSYPTPTKATPVGRRGDSALEENNNSEHLQENDLREIAADIGFLTPEHQFRWEEVWVGKIPLLSICKNPSDVVKDDWGYKHTASDRLLAKWQRRYFVLILPFIYYFDKEEMAALCRGAIYLPRAEINEVDIDRRSAIEIKPRVQRKPKRPGAVQDFGSFVISFDSDRQQKIWLRMLRQVSEMTNFQPIQRVSKSTRFAEPAARQSPPRTHEPQYAAPPSSQKRNEFPLSREELVHRIRRIASHRNTNEVAECLMQFVEDEVTDSVKLWRLMESIELTTPSSPSAARRAPRLVSDDPEASKIQLMGNEDTEDTADSWSPPLVSRRSGLDNAASELTQSQLEQVRKSQEDMQAKFDEMIDLFRQQLQNTPQKPADSVMYPIYSIPRTERLVSSQNATSDEEQPPWSSNHPPRGPVPSQAAESRYRSPDAEEAASYVESASPIGNRLAQRLERMRMRKKVLDDIMKNLPS